MLEVRNTKVNNTTMSVDRVQQALNEHKQKLEQRLQDEKNRINDYAAQEFTRSCETSLHSNPDEFCKLYAPSEVLFHRVLDKLTADDPEFQETILAEIAQKGNIIDNRTLMRMRDWIPEYDISKDIFVKDFVNRGTQRKSITEGTFAGYDLVAYGNDPGFISSSIQYLFMLPFFFLMGPRDFFDLTSFHFKIEKTPVRRFYFF